MEIKLGHIIPKPVITLEQCSQYAAAAQAVDQHNRSCTPGQMLWTLLEQPGGYQVVQDQPLAPPAPTVEEQLAALQAAQADTDAVAVDQEYRLTLLEAGVDPTIT